MSLEKERKIFESKLPELLVTHHGQWAWVHDDTISFYDSYIDAIWAAYTTNHKQKTVLIDIISEKKEVVLIPGYYG